MATPKIKTADIATAINARLGQLERDPKTNLRMKWIGRSGREESMPTFYNAGAYVDGRGVMVRYISFQGSTKLNREDALAYLDYLDSGGTGTHYALRLQISQGLKAEVAQ